MVLGFCNKMVIILIHWRQALGYHDWAEETADATESLR